jgi:hypothetical protein
MIFGKTLRVFAATLVLTSSISFADPGGTGTNNTNNAPADGAQQTNPLALQINQYTKVLSNGELETATIEDFVGEGPEEAAKAEKYVKDQLAENIAAGGHPTLIGVNPSSDSLFTEEKFLPAIHPEAVVRGKITLPEKVSAYANQKWLEAKNQFRVDPDFGARARVFGQTYWKDFKEFPTTKAIDKVNVSISLIKITIGFGFPFLAAVYGSGAHNIAPHLAYKTYLTFAFMSAAISHVATLLPWNRKNIPLPADTGFWKSFVFSAKATFWYLTEVGFVLLGRAEMVHTNDVAIHNSEAAPFTDISPKIKVWTDTAPQGTGAQAPYELGNGQIYAKGMEKADADLKANPLFADQIRKTQERLYFSMLAKNAVISAITTTIASAQIRGWTHANLGFGALYVGATIFTLVVWNVPAKILEWYKSTKTNGVVTEEAVTEGPHGVCSQSLESLKFTPKDDI